MRIYMYTYSICIRRVYTRKVIVVITDIQAYLLIKCVVLSIYILNTTYLINR